ncbi:putative small auxin-up RNA [Helianthus debilis subsp. tardiflorus]
MAICMPRIIQARQILKRSLSNGGSTPASMDIPKGYFAIYVGEQEKKRSVVTVSILSEPRFQECRSRNRRIDFHYQSLVYNKQS